MNLGLGLPLGAPSDSSGGGAPTINPNLLTKTEQFDAAAWVKVGVTVTPNVAVDPLGGSTADQLASGVTATITQISATVAVSGSGLAAPLVDNVWTRSSVTGVFNTGTFTFSIWLKDPLGNGSLVQLRLAVAGGLITCKIQDGGDGLTYLAWGAKLEIGSVPTGTAATYGAVA